MRPILFHLPIVGMLLILGFFSLIDAGRLDGFRSETTFGWMVVVGYPLVALLGLAQVAIWIRWISKRGMPSWIRSRSARRIIIAGCLVLIVLALVLLVFRMAERWGFLG